MIAKVFGQFSLSCVHDNCNSTSVLAYIVIYPSAYLCATREYSPSNFNLDYNVRAAAQYSAFLFHLDKNNILKGVRLTFGLNYTQTSFYVVIVVG